jgi:hypothetical protein
MYVYQHLQFQFAMQLHACDIFLAAAVDEQISSAVHLFISHRR